MMGVAISFSRLRRLIVEGERRECARRLLVCTHAASTEHVDERRDAVGLSDGDLVIEVLRWG